MYLTIQIIIGRFIFEHSIFEVVFEFFEVHDRFLFVTEVGDSDYYKDKTFLKFKSLVVSKNAKKVLLKMIPNLF